MGEINSQVTKTESVLDFSDTSFLERLLIASHIVLFRKVTGKTGYITITEDVTRDLARRLRKRKAVRKT